MQSDAFHVEHDPGQRDTDSVCATRNPESRRQPGELVPDNQRGVPDRMLDARLIPLTRIPLEYLAARPDRIGVRADQMTMAGFLDFIFYSGGVCFSTRRYRPQCGVGRLVYAGLHGSRSCISGFCDHGGKALEPGHHLSIAVVAARRTPRWLTRSQSSGYGLNGRIHRRVRVDTALNDAAAIRGLSAPVRTRLPAWVCRTSTPAECRNPWIAACRPWRRLRRLQPPPSARSCEPVRRWS